MASLFNKSSSKASGAGAFGAGAGAGAGRAGYVSEVTPLPTATRDGDAGLKLYGSMDTASGKKDIDELEAMRRQHAVGEPVCAAELESQKARIRMRMSETTEARAGRKLREQLADVCACQPLWHALGYN